MSKTFLNKLSVGILSMAAMTGSAFATTNGCPLPAGMTQTQEKEGFSYTAAALNGQQWSGEDPKAVKSDLARLTFKEAYIRNDKNFVACDYVMRDAKGTEEGGVRMVLEVKAPARPLGKFWSNVKQPNGATLPRCVGSDPALCKFE